MRIINSKEKEENIVDVEVLRKKIQYLEEELVRKQDIIDKLKKENLILFRTALKNSEKKAEENAEEKAKKQAKTI